MKHLTPYRQNETSLSPVRGRGMGYGGEVITLSIDKRDEPFNILIRHAGDFAFVINRKHYELHLHAIPSALSSAINSSSVIILCSPRLARFTSSKARVNDSLTYASWRRFSATFSALPLNTLTDATPRSISMALRTCSVVASSFNVTNICVIIVIFLFSGAKIQRKIE